MARGGSFGYRIDVESKKAVRETDKLSTALVTQRKKAKKLNDKLRTTAKRAKKAGDKFKTLGRTAKGTGTKIGGLTGKLGGLAAGLGGVVVAIQQVTDAFKKQAEFQKNLAEVSTLVDTTKVNMGEFRRQLIDMRVPFPLTDLTKGLYQLISAGVDSADAMRVLGVATELAMGGVASAAEAVDLLTTVLNAYELGTDKAIDVSDKLFTAVRLGKLEVGELASNLGKVASTAHAAGLSIGETLTALILMTKGGISLSESTTALNALLVAMIRKTDGAKTMAKELGIDLSVAAIKANGFASVMEAIGTASQGDIDIIAQLIPELTGMKMALIASGDEGETFKNILVEVEDSLGATGVAAAKMAGTIDVKFKKMTKSLEGLKVTAAEAFDKDLGGFLVGLDWAIRKFTTLQRAINDMGEFFDRNIQKMKTGLYDFFGSFMPDDILDSSIFTDLADKFKSLTGENAATKQAALDVEVQAEKDALLVQSQDEKTADAEIAAQKQSNEALFAASRKSFEEMNKQSALDNAAEVAVTTKSGMEDAIKNTGAEFDDMWEKSLSGAWDIIRAIQEMEKEAQRLNIIMNAAFQRDWGGGDAPPPGGGRGGGGEGRDDPGSGRGDTSGRGWDRGDRQMPFHAGGPITRAHQGMRIRDDEVPIIAQRGEFILRKSAAESIGQDTLQRMNRTGSRGMIQRNEFNAGGVTINIIQAPGQSADATAQAVFSKFMEESERGVKVVDARGIRGL